MPHTTFTVRNCCCLVSKLGQRSAAACAKGIGPVLFPVLSKRMVAYPVGQGPGGAVGRCMDSCPEKILPRILFWQDVSVWVKTKLQVPKVELRDDSSSERKKE